MASPHLFEHIEQWLGKRWVLATINLTLLALLSFSLARGTWRMLAPGTAGGAPAVSGINDASGDYNLPALLSSNLFGQAAAVPRSAAVSLETIPLSSLNLVLTGVLVTPTGSYALISADGSPELPFGIGQEVISGVSLYAVYADRVLIRRGGATESLMLKDAGADLPDGSVLVGSPQRPGRSNAAGPVRRQADNRFDINRRQLTQQMQTPEFLTQALMVPNAGGGFLVREIKPGSLYEKLGLQVGDVIHMVNGQAVNTVEDVMRLYQQFETVANVEIQVRRAGQTETLSYNIQ